MKTKIKYYLQKLLGYENYLFVFSLFKIHTLELDRKENDFFHFLGLIPDKGIVLDIGANIGIMTVKLAQRLPNSKVLAFEPVPQNFSTLKKVVTYFNLKNVKIFDFALGDKEGKTEMVVPVVSSVKMQGLSHVVHDSIKEFNEGDKLSIDIKTLDNLPELLSDKPITAIKMDVENFEYFVLEGGKQTLAKHKPLLYCELWANENREKCFDLMKGLGYQIKVLKKRKLIDYLPEKHKTQNFFFVWE